MGAGGRATSSSPLRWFDVVLVGRLALLVANLVALAYVLTRTGYVAVPIVAAALAAVQTASLLRFLRRTNRDLARFLDAVRHADFSQGFSEPPAGSGFPEVAEALRQIASRFREARLAREQRGRYLATLVEHVPVPLLSIHAGGRVELLNSAGRRLLAAGRVQGIADLERYGARFRRDLEGLGPGERKLTQLCDESRREHLVVAATQISLGGDVEKLVSLQNIQNELDSAELEAWQDMVRVLTHEIMNSITPVASLTRTARDLLQDFANRDWDGSARESLTDALDAIATAARRSDGLMQFVHRYRQFTQMPPPRFEQLSLRGSLDRAGHLMAQTLADGGVGMEVAVTPEGLSVSADPELFEQTLINLIQNAVDALSTRQDRRVWVGARLGAKGRVVVEVADNGPGVDEALRERIFVPFFTTKRHGSGVGLSLARQVMLLHGGSIAVGERPGGGALVALIF